MKLEVKEISVSISKEEATEIVAFIRSHPDWRGTDYAKGVVGKLHTLLQTNYESAISLKHY